MLVGTSILGKPLECTYCGVNSNWICSTYQQFNMSAPAPDPGFNQFFIPRYCHKQMSDFILYMPFILILLAGFLILFDRPIDSYLFRSFDENKVYQTAVIDLQDLTYGNRTQKVKYQAQGQILSPKPRSKLNPIKIPNQEIRRSCNQYPGVSA